MEQSRGFRSSSSSIALHAILTSQTEKHINDQQAADDGTNTGSPRSSIANEAASPRPRRQKVSSGTSRGGSISSWISSRSSDNGRHRGRRSRSSSSNNGSIMGDSAADSHQTGSNAAGKDSIAAASSDERAEWASDKQGAGRLSTEVAVTTTHAAAANGDQQLHLGTGVDAGVVAAKVVVNADSVSSSESNEALGMPDADVWTRELLPFLGMMLNPNRPWVKPFILNHCYIYNTPATRERYRSMKPQSMHKLMRDRVQVERRLSLAAHALEASWKRLQLLAEAVRDKGQVLTEPQLNKDRELLVQLRDGIAKGQSLLDRCVSKASEAGDRQFLTRHDVLRRLYQSLSATADAYLREFMRRISAASRLNEQHGRKWAAMEDDTRPPVPVAEAARQQQLQALQALAPRHPTDLLAQYRMAALSFECYKDTMLFERKAGTGQPSSAGGLFWQGNSNDNSTAFAPAILYSTSSSRCNDSSSVQQQHHEQTPTITVSGTAIAPTVTSSGPQAGAIDSKDTVQQAADQIHAVQRQQLQPLAVSGNDSWQQYEQWQQHQPLPTASTMQQVPLLPRLAKHREWLTQYQVTYDPARQQQQQQSYAAQRQQRLQQWQRNDSKQQQQQQPPLPQQQLLLPGSQALSAANASDAGSDASMVALKRRTISFSGKVIPPMAILLHRALRVEQELVQQAAIRSG